MNSAARVGALLIITGGLAYAGLSVLGKGVFGKKTQSYYVSMPDAGGLAVGTRVTMAGVVIGTVAAVELASPNEAKLTLQIRDEVKIPAGAYAQLPTSLTGLGDSYVAVVAPATTTSLLSPGATMVGRKAKALEGLLPNGEEAVAEMTRTLAAFRKILEDDQLLGQVKSLMAATKGTAAEFGKTAAGVNSLIADNRAQLKQTLVGVGKIVADVRRTSSELAKFAESGTLQKGSKDLIASLNASARKGDQMLESINKIISDPTLKEKIDKTTANVATMTDSGVRMAASGEKIAGNFETIAKDGTEISKRAITLMDNFNEVAQKASKIEDQISKAIDKVGGVLSKGPSNPFEGAVARYDLMRESDPGYFRTDFTVRIPQSKGGDLYVGIFDAFYSNRLTAQLSKPLDERLALRYGLFASRPAFGVDYLLGPKTSLRGDVWDINNPRFDFRFSQDLGKGLVGWLGMDRVFRDNALTVGLGIVR